jgi:fluoride exporter
MLNNLLFIAIGAFFGAISRFALINELKKRIQRNVPYPTMIVNMSGSFLLGITVGLNVYTTIYFILAVGFLGAYTTFSTFAVEAVTLLRSKNSSSFFIYFIGTFLGGVLFCLVGWKIGTIL